MKGNTEIHIFKTFQMFNLIEMERRTQKVF
jgi:hypothetical protein